MRDWQIYQAIYCGLCKCIRQKYGQIPGLALTYDLTFFALLFSALQEDKLDMTQESCIANPWLKRPVLYSASSGENKTTSVLDGEKKKISALELAADLTVLLAYFKGEDDIADKSSMKGKAIKIFLTSAMRKARKEAPQMYELIATKLSELNTAERTFAKQRDLVGKSVASKPSYIFGELLGEISSQSVDLIDFPASIQQLKPALYKIGYHIGVWIYLIDAYDDLKEDIKNNEFNYFRYFDDPLMQAKNELQKQQEELDRYAAILPYQRYGDIIYNIICDGMITVQNKILAGEKLPKI